MKTLIITALLLLAGCAMNPEQRALMGAALYQSGQNWSRVAVEQQVIADRWQNYRYQQQQLYLMQQQNAIMQQRGCR